MERLRKLAKRLDSLQAVRNARVRGRFRFLMPSFNLLLKLKTRNPVGFNEKVEYKMARDRRPLLTVFADKLEAKKYVERVLGPGYVPEVLAVADRAADLPWDELPEEVALKVNHGSGGCVISWAGVGSRVKVLEARPENMWRVALVSPALLDPEATSAFLDMHLSRSFSWISGEWAYRDVQPRVLAEEYLSGEHGLPPIDYRMYCFGGRCETIMVIAGQVQHSPTMAGEYLADFFTRDWAHLEGLRKGAIHHRETPERPADLEEMLAISDALSRETDFVRVDLIRSEGRVVVGELTNYPNAGRVPMIPASFELWLGNLWATPVDYSTYAHGTYPLPVAGSRD